TVDLRVVRLVKPRDAGCQMTMFNVRDDFAERAECGRELWDHNATDPELTREQGRVRGPCAPANNEREVPRIVTSFNRHSSDSAEHVGGDHAENSQCGLLYGEIQRLRDLVKDHSSRGSGIETEFAAQQRSLIQISEHDERICDSGRRAASIVRSRAW